jgi:hypothetical protein
MKDQPIIKWSLANAAGLGTGFVAMLQAGMLIEHGFDFEKHWQGVPPPDPAPLTFYFKVLVCYLVLGTIFGLAQTLVLRSRSVSVSAWILATSAGYGLTAVLLWPLIAFNVLGNIPGPVEPILVTVGGGSVAGVVQYLMLRRRGIVATRWLLLWVLGLVVSLVPLTLFFMSIGGLEIAQSQLFQVFFAGFVTAGVAALISGKALLRALPSAREDNRALVAESTP